MGSSRKIDRGFMSEMAEFRRSNLDLWPSVQFPTVGSSRKWRSLGAEMGLSRKWPSLDPHISVCIVCNFRPRVYVGNSRVKPLNLGLYFMHFPTLGSSRKLQSLSPHISASTMCNFRPRVQLVNGRISPRASRAVLGAILHRGFKSEMADITPNTARPVFFLIFKTQIECSPTQLGLVEFVR